MGRRDDRPHRRNRRSPRRSVTSTGSSGTACERAGRSAPPAATWTANWSAGTNWTDWTKRHERSGSDGRPRLPTDRMPGEVKMVLVLRGELRLTAGKTAVQAAHAAVMLAESTRVSHPKWLAVWRQQGQKKIALLANDLDEMEE